MLTFLKKLGQILNQGAQVASIVFPFIRPFLGSGKAATVTTTAVNDFTLIAQQVVTVETALTGPGRGVEKLAAVIPLIGNIIRTSEVVSGKKIYDDALFTKAVQGYAQATVDLLNSIHPDEAAHA